MQRDLRRLRDRAAEQAERDERRDGAAVGAAAKTSSYCRTPVCWISRKSAIAIAASPPALMMNAFFAASIADGLCW